MPEVKGRLKPADEKRIRVNYSALVKEIDAEYFISELFSKEVFTSADKEEVNAQINKEKRTELMLDKLLHSGPGVAYTVFFEILSKQYAHMADLLTNTPVDETASVQNYSWVNDIPESLKQHKFSDAFASRISDCFDENWQRAILRLGVDNSTINRAKADSRGESSSGTITKLLIMWRRKKYDEANIQKLLDVLVEVDSDNICSIDWECVHKALDKEKV